MSTANAQVYDSDMSLEHFAKFAALFAAVADYRQNLMLEAEQVYYFGILYVTI